MAINAKLEGSEMRVMRCINATWAIATAVILLMSTAIAQAQTVIGQVKPERFSTTFGVGGPAVELSWPVLVADQQGYFREQGIEVTQFTTAGANTLVHSFTAQHIDFLAAGIFFPINLRAGGFPAKTILEFNAKEIFQLVARTGVKSEVKTVRDLKGRRLGHIGAGGLAWMAGLLALKSAGLNPDRGDVQYIGVGGTPAELVTALQQGKIDAAAVWEPILTRVLRDRSAYVLLSSADPEQNRQWWGTDRIQDLGLITREDLIKSKPEMLKGVVSATKRALDFIRTQPPERIADVVLAHPKGKEWWGNLDRDVIIGSTTTAKGLLGDGCMSPPSFETLMDLLVEYKISKKRISFSEYADTRWAGVCPQ